MLFYDCRKAGSKRHLSGSLRGWHLNTPAQGSNATFPATTYSHHNRHHTSPTKRANQTVDTIQKPTLGRMGTQRDRKENWPTRPQPEQTQGTTENVAANKPMAGEMTQGRTRGAGAKPWAAGPSGFQSLSLRPRSCSPWHRPQGPSAPCPWHGPAAALLPWPGIIFVFSFKWL